MSDWEVDRYAEMFMPMAFRRRARVAREGLRFAYYTNAVTANLIISRREIWMRSLMVMNDYSEVEHGLQCVKSAFETVEGTRFKAALDKAFPGLADGVISKFNAWIPGLRRSTYVACLSEHGLEDDQFGRLSMWRAYGGEAGIALIVKPDFMALQTDALGAYTSPVEYLKDDQVLSELRAVADRLEANTDLLLKYGHEAAEGAFFEMLRFAALCTKHPAFLEEREWRIVACPVMHPTSLLRQEIEVIGGVPQPVIKLSLVNHPDHGLVGLEPTSLIDRVLIGPCEHAEVIYQAIHSTMSAAGFEKPEEKIVLTGIPLRPNQR